MKRTVAIVIGIILIVVILYYFWFVRVVNIGSSNITATGAATINTAQTAANAVKNNASQQTSGITTGISNAIGSIESALQTVSNDVTTVINNSKQSAKQAIATTLGITPTVIEVPASPGNFNNSSPSTGSPIAIISGDTTSTNSNASNGVASGNGKFTVCSINKKKTSQTYMIQNLLSPNQGLSYEATWGDGAITTGTIVSTQQNVSVSHSYNAAGIYNVVFYATVGSTTITMDEQACVQ